ncbi:MULTISPECIES: class I SAM-dependent methyltransferase [unclassified Methanoregula]|uniref:class I SAM-dependent methyltransferase n=1 Tax=unclassified Methanoregula TaxID=2649730 RepID=UPI0009CC684A|nr:MULTISPECIES: class I SAM-dependent methyltransferase [unclassified Methanoregula]OPX63203.1 MAG: hypothetical protein A4E33_01886 [Methanoregula sp. PtaB.Bin085]OPY33503.1 MAG: hypothetical protein A4E34_01826 [Methanoregula sp. PtaU1.Bin006]
MTTDTRKRNPGTGKAVKGKKEDSGSTDITGGENRSFDAEAATWDSEPGRVKLADDVAQAIRGMVSLTPEMDVLDFGCGTGLLTLHLQPLVRSITGVDSSQGMLAVFDGKIRKQGITNARTRFADLNKGDMPDGRYDLVISSMTFHHIRDIPHLLKMMAGVLRPSGQIAVIDLDPDGGKFHSSNAGVFHFGFERSVMKDLLEAEGFVSVRDRTAAIMQRPSPSGEARDFPVFIMTGRKPE